MGHESPGQETKIFKVSVFTLTEPMRHWRLCDTMSPLLIPALAR